MRELRRDHVRMKQATLAAAVDRGAEFERFRRPTRRDVFLQTMNAIVPWGELCAVIQPHYPKAGNGRPPIVWPEACERTVARSRRQRSDLEFPLHVR